MGDDIYFVGFVVFVIGVIALWFYFENKRISREMALDKEMKEKGYKKCKVCPNCESENIVSFVQQEYHSSKTKDSYSVNLNPLKPLTVMNKKEKVVVPENTTSKTMWQCKKCGKIFESPGKAYIKK